ncbi:MAG: glycoside hydrolase family 15 protein [Desulfobacteraceae bacterium]|jgi:oligosaccharide amylase
MPRDIPVGNGRLLACFDKNYAIRDLYFPHVGQENHVSGNVFRFGVFAGGSFSWVGEAWKRELAYEEDTLVSQVNLYHQEQGVLITCRDAVDFHEDVYLREVTVENLVPEKRRIELFFSQDFDISGNSVGDTAAFDPASGGIVHYKGSRYFLVSGLTEQSESLSQFAVGQKKVGGKEGTFRDAEDGLLSGNTIAQGSVDSVVSLHLDLDGHSAGKAYYWICAAESWAEARRIDDLVRHKHPRALIKRTGDYWNLWVRKESPSYEHLPSKVARLYRRSLLVMSTQLDWQGGIVAANDSDVIQFNRDTYSYVWPRDGALIAHALDLAGYPMPAQRFYDFSARAIEDEGYLLHKYNPDGTLASSWHPWYEGNEAQLPIQEDETALVIWALWHHFVQYRDIEFVKPLYRPLVKRAADFMVAYRDEETGLPGASYDLWEERRGISSFTVSAVFGGLAAASIFCTVFGEEEKARTYRQAASEIRDAASNYLWREDLGRFCRMLYRNGKGALEVDGTCDASLWGLFTFGLYTASDPRIEATMEALRQKLWLSTKTGGMARYENDTYYRAGGDITGNPWFISTLWLADYLLEKVEDEEALNKATEILCWVADHALPSGVLPEQLQPHTGEPLSVSPLTWSHAAFVSTMQLYQSRMARKEAEVPSAKAEDWIGKLFAETCDVIHGACRVK